MQFVRYVKFMLATIRQRREIRKELDVCDRYSEILTELTKPMGFTRPLANAMSPEEFQQKRRELRRLKYQLEMDEAINLLASVDPDQN